MERSERSLYDDLRPPLALRVGVVGHRVLDHPDAVSRAVGEAIGTIADALVDFAKNPLAMRRYRLDSEARPILHIAAGLAEGADQIAARAALDFQRNGSVDVDLVAVLPGPAADFVDSFSTSDAERWKGGFWTLLQEARGAFVLDGASSGPASALAFEAATRTIVVNSDVLLAVWNGKDGAGWGGTQWAIQLAFEMNVPVLWIDARSGGTPHAAGMAMLTSRDELVAALTASGTNRTALAELAANVRRLVAAPEGDASYPTTEPHHPEEAAEHGATPPITAWIDRAAERRQHSDGSGAVFEAFLLGRPFSGRGALPVPNIHSLLKRLFGASNRTAEKPNLSISRPSEKAAGPPHIAPFLSGFEWADRTAIALAERDRAAIATSVVFGTLAALLAVTGFALPEFKHAIPEMAPIFSTLKPLLLALEFGILLYIVAVVYDIRSRSITQAWLAARLLAELLRTAPYLHRSGRELRLSPDLGGAHATGAIAPWAIWYYQAVVRAAGIACVDHSDPVFRDATIRQFLDELVSDQLRYNKATQRSNHSIALGLEWFGEIFFIATLLFLCVKGGMMIGHAPDVAMTVVTGLTIVLPLLSAGLLALRELGGFLNVERRSANMALELERARVALEALSEGPARSAPLRAVAAGAIQERVARQMAGDAANWVALFETKNPVAG